MATGYKLRLSLLTMVAMVTISSHNGRIFFFAPPLFHFWDTDQKYIKRHHFSEISLKIFKFLSYHSIKAMNYYNDFIYNASPIMNTPFLDSSSTVDTPCLDYIDSTSEEIMSMIFGHHPLPEEPQNNDIYVAGYLDMDPVPTFNGDPNVLTIDKSKPIEQTMDTLFPPLMSSQEQIPQEEPVPQTTTVNKKKNKTSAASPAKRVKPIKLYQCPHCDHKSKRRFNLNTHIKTHDKARLKDFDCPKCPKRFDRRHDRDRHVATVHNPNKYNPCQYCDQKYTRPDALKRHLISKHHFSPIDFE